MYQANNARHAQRYRSTLQSVLTATLARSQLSLLRWPAVSSHCHAGPQSVVTATLARSQLRIPLFAVIAFGGSWQQPRDEFLPPARRDQVEAVEQEAEVFRGEVRNLRAQRELKGFVGSRMARGQSPRSRHEVSVSHWLSLSLAGCQLIRSVYATTCPVHLRSCFLPSHVSCTHAQVACSLWGGLLQVPSVPCINLYFATPYRFLHTRGGGGWVEKLGNIIDGLASVIAITADLNHSLNATV